MGIDKRCRKHSRESQIAGIERGVKFSKARDNAIEIKTNDEDDERQWESISAQKAGRFVATIQPRLGVILEIIQLWVTAWKSAATHR